MSGNLRLNGSGLGSGLEVGEVGGWGAGLGAARREGWCTVKSSSMWTRVLRAIRMSAGERACLLLDFGEGVVGECGGDGERDDVGD